LFLFIGALPALVSFFIFRRALIGGFWGALVASVFGSFIGAAADYFIGDYIFFVIPFLNDIINIFPPMIFALLFTVVYVMISRSRTVSPRHDPFLE
jgi:ABC-type dipeptide/oligopeptide/nickel transport system permease subunit